MKELSFSRRNLILLVVIVCLTIAGIVLIHHFSPSPHALEATPSAYEAQANAAAIGVEAFFQIGTAEGEDAWRNRFCAVSTKNGCDLLRMAADRLWKKYADARISVQAEAIPLKLISETTSEQVWKVNVQLTDPLPGSNKTKDVAYVLVVKSGDDWKFDRFLLEPEVLAIEERQKKEAQQ